MVICTARSDRWGINNPEYDAVAKDVRVRCRAAGIACKQGREFWESLRPWATLMGGMHHKDGGWKSLAWCWDREFVRTCILKTAGMEDRHRLKILWIKSSLLTFHRQCPRWRSRRMCASWAQDLYLSRFPTENRLLLQWAVSAAALSRILLIFRHSQ